jgi:hypothetical protein
LASNKLLFKQIGIAVVTMGTMAASCAQSEAQRRTAQRPVAKNITSTSFVAIEAGSALLQDTNLWAGYDLAALFKVADKTLAVRGEFESPAEYEARLALRTSQVAYGNIRLGSSIALVAPTLVRATSMMHVGGAPVGYKYNADEGVLNVCWSGEDFISDGFGRVVEAVAIQKIARTNGVGQNAYGAKVPISVSTGEQYVIGVKVGVNHRCPINLNISGVDAQRLLDEAGVVVVGRLVSPFLDQRVIKTGSTFSSPIEATIHVSRLLFMPQEMILLHKRTRAVIARQPIVDL